MEEIKPEERRLILEVDQLIILHPDGPAGGFPMVVRVERIADGLHWFLGCCEPIRCGETMTVESPIHDDARYVTRASVAASTRETFALELKPAWERVQQRAFVRIDAYGLQVRVLRPSSPLSEGIDSQPPDGSSEHPDSVHDLLDISAGGIRFACDHDYELDEQVVCHFELPGSLCFVLPAQIVRPSEDHPPGGNKPTVAVEFIGLDENNRSQLLRWIYREQVDRHRARARQGL